MIFQNLKESNQKEKQSWPKNDKKKANPIMQKKEKEKRKPNEISVSFVKKKREKNAYGAKTKV